MRRTRKIEWPPGSGVYAEYTPAEEALLRDLAGCCESGQITERQLAREVAFVHSLKAKFGARLVEDEPVYDAPVEARQIALA